MSENIIDCRPTIVAYFRALCTEFEKNMCSANPFLLWIVIDTIGNMSSILCDIWRRLCVCVFTSMTKWFTNHLLLVIVLYIIIDVLEKERFCKFVVLKCLCFHLTKTHNLLVDSLLPRFLFHTRLINHIISAHFRQQSVLNTLFLYDFYKYLETMVNNIRNTHTRALRSYFFYYSHVCKCKNDKIELVLESIHCPAIKFCW
jgi:hypothetical protein